MRKRAAAISLTVLGLVAVAIAGCRSGGHTGVSPSPGGGNAVIEFTSPAFGPYGSIPVNYASQGIPGGRNVSIPYAWTGAPDGTASFALALVDRARVADNWVHWIVVDIPRSASSIAEGASGSSQMPKGSRELKNTFGSMGYRGPQPPAGTGEHPYEATLYALDVSSLALGPQTTLDDFYRAIDGHVIAQASWSGRFARP